jgi:preprotein translocase subunit SecY
VLLIGFIVLMTNAERRIPVQYAKRVVGRKMYGGNSSHIPIKVNMSGVLPVIFASAFLSIPGTIKSFAYSSGPVDSLGYKILSWFDYNTVLYAVLYFVLIIAFNYFYVAIQYNPVEMANNLRKNSGAIPGIRPGQPTSDFIAKILSRITLMGAIFLGVIAVLPIFVSAIGKVQLSLGGTSIIILVGVALDTVQNLESQMMMRHYKGFLD